MDGMQHALSPQGNAVGNPKGNPIGVPAGMASFRIASQSTLKTSIDCVGIGLHSGRRVKMALHPAAPNHGIVFRRTDLGPTGPGPASPGPADPGHDIPARFDLVVDTRLATVLADPADPTVRVSTVEHVMAALTGCGIDNALIDVDGPEVPVLDGSAAHLVFLIDCAGTAIQDAPRRAIQVLRAVRVSDGDAFAELSPARPTHDGLDLAMSIEFAAAAIGHQALSLRLTPDSFRQELSRARTFALAEDIDRLRAAGMARGGSLENAVVVDAARVLNPGGLRMHDEFVRHKLLDAVGDLALAGAPLAASFTAHRSGHGLNNRLLRALLADASAWRMVTDVPVRVAA
jgi:UDP-3-O-[3-hydroxymyristoyl] N-acetylglucosamine deacetylase